MSPPNTSTSKYKFSAFVIFCPQSCCINVSGIKVSKSGLLLIGKLDMVVGDQCLFERY